MANTTNYELEKYEAGNSANLLDQYNESMDKIDAAIKSASDKADLALNNNVLPAGLAAFIEALGLTETNAKTLGTTLNHILNRVGTEIFTVTDLSKLKKPQKAIQFHQSTKGVHSWHHKHRFIICHYTKPAIWQTYATDTTRQCAY